MDAPSQVKEEERQEEVEKKDVKEEEYNIDSKQGRHSLQFTEKCPDKIKEVFLFVFFVGILLLMTTAEESQEKHQRLKNFNSISGIKISQEGSEKQEEKEEEDNVDSKRSRHSHQFTEKFPNKDEKMHHNTDTSFDGNSHQKQLELKKENFGKIQQPHDAHILEEVLKLGKSVCLLMINIFQEKVQGTGFLLFDNFILTNAHLFEVCTKLKHNKWREHVKITATFYYGNPDCDSNKKEFTAKLFGGYNIGLDYAILEINTVGTVESELPPGLLSKCGPPPDNGETCLIGYPAGGVKQIDLTCIIAKKDRDQAVNQNLKEYGDHIFTLYAINQEIRKDPYADIYVTYNTSMYHGSSGSPVFDAYGRVFGLHSGGFFFDFVKPNESVIEFALPLPTIFENFVSELKRSGNKELLERVQEAGNGNPYIEQIFEGLNDEEPMETN